MSKPPLTEQENKAEQPTSQSRKVFDRSDWLALFAMLISMAALAVSAYEASILREQQQLMQTQQKASVWPYLLIESAFKIDASQGGATWTCKVTNKGVGPALIKEVRLLFAGEELDQYDEISDYLKPKFPEGALVALSYSPIEGDIISSNESVELFRVITDVIPGLRDLMDDVKSEVDICYCSIYEDCWMANDGEVVSTNGCPTR